MYIIIKYTPNQLPYKFLSILQLCILYGSLLSFSISLFLILHFTRNIGKGEPPTKKLNVDPPQLFVIYLKKTIKKLQIAITIQYSAYYYQLPYEVFAVYRLTCSCSHLSERTKQFPICKRFTLY